MLWDVFISYASEDREEVAHPLAVALKQKGFRVWFDEFALKPGDSLRRSIDDGLATSRFAIVILSPHFFRKEWPSRELDGLVAREITSGKIILPVWHDLNAQDIARFSPPLADRVGVSTHSGIQYVADEMQRAISDSPPREGLIDTTSHSNLQVIDTSVDEDGCFYQMRRRHDLVEVNPTSAFHPFTSSTKDIFPIIDIKLRNIGFEPSFLYRVSLAIMKASPVEWGKEYYYPAGPVHVSARYHLLLSPELVGGTVTQTISLKVAPHDVERFQMRLASENAIKYEVRCLLHFDVGGILDLGIFLFTIPGALCYPEKIIGPTVDDKLAVLRYDSDHFAKAVAAHELARIGSKRAASTLLNALAHLDAKVRSAAIEALGHCGNVESVEILSRLLKLDPDEVVRRSAASALGQLGDHSAAGELTSALSDTDPEVRKAAAESLGSLRVVTAVTPLIRQLEMESDWWIRHSVAAALAKIGDSAAFGPLIASARRHPSSQGEIKAIRELRHPESIGFFVELLGGDDEWARREAAEALGDLGNPAAKPALQARLGRDDSAAVREAAAISLALLGDTKHLRAGRRSNSWWTTQLVEELPGRGNTRALPVLHEIARVCSDRSVLIAVAKGLSALGDSYGREILRRQLQEGSDAVEAAECLARLGDPSGSRYLEEALATSSSHDVRVASACAMARIQHHAAFPLLVNELTSGITQRLQEVALALGQLGDVKALPALMDAWRRTHDKGIGTWSQSVNDRKRAIESGIESLLERMNPDARV